VYGYEFCKAAKWAFQLITRNVVRVFVVDKIGDFLMLIGKVIITLLVGIAGNILIEYYDTQPTFWLTPMLVSLSLSLLAEFPTNSKTLFGCFRLS